jgi:hypothetical protein
LSDRSDGRVKFIIFLIYDYARKVLNLGEEARSALAELRALESGKVALGTNESSVLYLLPVLKRFPHNYAGGPKRWGAGWPHVKPSKNVTFRAIEMGSGSGYVTGREVILEIPDPTSSSPEAGHETQMFCPDSALI